MKWLRARTVFQRVALVLMALALAAGILSPNSNGHWFDLPILALVVCYFAFRKQLLWRVRNRLLVTYLLFAIVPIFLIALALMLASELLLGQFAAQRVRQDLEARIEGVRSTARTQAPPVHNAPARPNLSSCLGPISGSRKSQPALISLVILFLWPISFVRLIKKYRER